ncbi:MAG: zinc-ribbon domain-containing protein [Gammaproteobacteria bacterium]|nr:zinc-ribbon domain-containing protein [Gammaproteobacteria bacterium]
MKIRCPSCTTLFSTTIEMVEDGHGLVRCSRCRNVFKATEHTEDSPPDESLERVDESTARENSSAPELESDRFGHLPAWIRGELLSQLGSHAGNGARLRKLASVVTVLALSTVLLAQIAYAQIERVSQINELRPGMKRLCELLHCHPPPMRQLELVRLTDSQIIWREDGAIELKISIANEAEFDQSWPAVHVSMSNYLNQAVAEGRFRPDQYAPPDAVIGAGQTVNAALLIASPGQRIRSYEITFH